MLVILCPPLVCVMEEDSICAPDKYATPLMSPVPVWWAGTADLWYIFCACQQRVRVSVCVGGWRWSFQGDFNIYYRFPLLLCFIWSQRLSHLSSDHPSPSLHSLSLSVFCLPFLFISPCHLPVKPPSLKLLVFLHPSLCFWNFSHLTFIAVFLLWAAFTSSASLSMPLFSPTISVYSFRKTTAYL